MLQGRLWYEFLVDDAQVGRDVVLVKTGGWNSCRRTQVRYPGCRFPGMGVMHNSRATRYLDCREQQLIGQRVAATNWQRVW